MLLEASILSNLICSVHRSIHRSISERPCVDILDHVGRVFGYIPAETRLSGWLLFGRKDLLMDGYHMMVIAKNVGEGCIWCTL